MEVSGRKRNKVKPRVIIHPKIFCKRALKRKNRSPIELKSEDEDPKSDFFLIVSRPKRVTAVGDVEESCLDKLMQQICDELKVLEDKDGLLLPRVAMPEKLDNCATLDRLGILMDLKLIEMNIKAYPYDLLGILLNYLFFFYFFLFYFLFSNN